MKPSRPAGDCWDCDALEPSTGRRPVAYATHASFRVHTSWSGECEPEFSFGFGAYTTSADRNPTVLCNEVAHDTRIECDGGQCAIEPGGMHTFEVTPETPGTVTVRATLAPLQGKPRTVDVATLRVERPVRITARCDGAAPEPGSVHVLLDLYSANTLLSGGMPELAIVGGDACVPAPVAPSDSSLPWRRYACTGSGSFEVEARGKDFNARTWVRCESPAQGSADER